jgi:hypothetical protein
MNTKSVALVNENNTWSAKRNASISGTCSLGMKAIMRVFLTVFHSSTETISFLHTSKKPVRC